MYYAFILCKGVHVCYCICVGQKTTFESQFSLVTIWNLEIKVVRCGGMNKNGSHWLIYLTAWPLVGGNVLERVGRCGLVEGSVSLGVGFEVSKACYSQSLPLDPTYASNLRIVM